MVALIEIFGYISANLIALANGRALGVLSGPILTSKMSIPELS